MAEPVEVNNTPTSQTESAPTLSTVVERRVSGSSEPALAQRVTSSASLALIALGVVVLVGWTVGLAGPNRISSQLVTMKANTAVCFILAGLSLWLLRAQGASGLKLRLAQVCAAVVVIVATITLAEYLLGWNLYVDQLLFRAAPNGDVHFPGRMSLVTALDFLFLGNALLLISQKKERNGSLAQLLTLLAGAITLIAFLGYFYQVEALYRVFPFGAIALHTVLGFLLLCGGILFARPTQGVMAAFFSDSAGGILARRLLPVAILAPPFFGWLRLIGERRGLFGAPLGVALVATILVIVSVTFVVRTARVIDRVDAVRKRAEERTRLVVEAAPSAMVMVNSQGQIVLVNAQTEKLFGYARTELLGQPVEILVPERYRHLHQDHREGFLRYPSTRAMGAGRDLYGRRKDGSEVPIEIGLKPIQTDEGSFVLADIIDITERKRTDDALRASEARLRLAHQAARIGTFEWNIQTGVNIWSPELEEMYGLPPGGFAGTQPAWEDLIHPDDRAAALACVQQALDAGGPGEGEWRVTWPDGSTHWLFARFQVFRDTSGTPLRLTGVNVDITERMRAEARVQRGKRIWDQTFDAIGEGILVHDDEMKIVRCNLRAAEMMNMRPAEVIGLSFSEAFARLFGNRAAAYYLAESRQPSSVFEVETESDRRYLVSMFPVEQPEGDSISVVTWTDVTRVLEMQEQLSRSRRLASVGELAAGVAHEINNPLAAITTCAEATMRDMRQSDATQALADSHQWSYYLEEIVRQALRCKEITRGLLDLTRQRQANRVMCDLNAITAQCARVAMQRANSSAVQIEISLDEKAGDVATDSAMVRQILDNLLSNAIDALVDGSGRISVSTARDSDRVAIEVADTGQGIPADLLSKVFDPFFTTKGASKGYGLGLAISLTLAESLSGSLTVESKEGAGSRFRLWIPRRAPGV